ncbi:MAG: cobalamin B12-binding domain-containing protein [Emergencia sp.]
MDIKINRRFNEKNLPDMKTIKNDARKIADGIEITETLFMKKYGVKSETEYKRKMMETGKIMKHGVIGWNSWQATAEGVRQVYETLEKEGSYIDRLGMICDWVMGVPEQYRDRFQASGSLIFNSPEEWNQIGQIAPINPHLGDHMIGSLNSVENVKNGLSAGVTSIGNLAQYFTYEYPGLDMEEYRTEDYIKAMAVMGEFKERGVCMHCNLDDGYGAQFHDVANLLGWARLERYIAEELAGGRVAHCYGNLFSDPMLRIVFNRALSRIDKYQTPGTFVNGNTIDYGMNMSRNYSVMPTYALADIACQMKYPTGYAVNAIPYSEALRIPSAEEIIECQLSMDMVIEKAPYYAEYIDWDRIEDEADRIAAGSAVFFERVINALDDLGVDIEHAGQVAAVLKAIGPEQLEICFGAGKSEENAMRGRIPVRGTSIVQTITRIRDEALSKLDDEKLSALEGCNIVVGSSDVHEFGKEVVKNVLLKAGANVFDLGTSAAVSEIVETIVESGSTIVCMSTYNGMAYSFGKALMTALKEAGLDHVSVLMGGRLNEAIEGNDVPVDVRDRLKELGINVDNDIDRLIEDIAAANSGISLK